MIAQKPEQNFCKTEIIFLTQNQRGPDRNSVNSANDSHFEIWADGGEKEIRAQLEQSLDAFFEFYPEI